MSDDRAMPDYNDSMIALVTFVKNIAADDTLEDHGLGQLREQASEVLGDFILASLFRLVGDRHPGGGPGSPNDK